MMVKRKGGFTQARLTYPWTGAIIMLAQPLDQIMMHSECTPIFCRRLCPERKDLKDSDAIPFSLSSTGTSSKQSMAVSPSLASEESRRDTPQKMTTRYSILNHYMMRLNSLSGHSRSKNIPKNFRACSRSARRTRDARR